MEHERVSHSHRAANQGLETIHGTPYGEVYSLARCGRKPALYSIRNLAPEAMMLIRQKAQHETRCENDFFVSQLPVSRRSIEVGTGSFLAPELVSD